MCWSEEVSWATFTFGMITSLQVMWIHKNNPMMLTLVAAWQPVIWMQFFEALVWRSISTEDGGTLGTYGAVFTALLQPPLMGLVLLTQKNVKEINRKVAVVLIIAHIYWYSYSLTQISPLAPLDLFDDVNCRHIDFAYWMDLSQPDVVYSFTTVMLFILLIPDIEMALFLIIMSLTTYTTTYLLYNCGESNGSMWCWFSSMMPFLMTIFDNFRSRVLSCKYE